MDDVAHVGLVDAHAERDGGDDDIDPLHEKIVLVARAGGGVHPGVVSPGLDAVGDQQLGELLDLLAAEAVDDAALTLVLLDETDDFAVDVVLGPDFVIEVGAVERRLEHGGVGHTQVLLDVQLHLGSGRGGQSDERRTANLVDDGPDTAVLGPEVVAPLRKCSGPRRWRRTKS